MHFEGTQTVNAPIDKVWAHILDPNKVAECAPGFKSMEILGSDHFKPTIAVGVGAVKATFTLDVHLVDVTPTSHAGMTGRGQAVGSAVELRADMTLSQASAVATMMAWTADVNVSGTIASMGARLLEGTAHKLTGRFFDCLRQKLEAPASVGSPAEVPSSTPIQ
jgi:uncharacterized protein